MKYCLIALILLVPLAAQAAAPEESYFAARDGYIQKFKSAGTNGKIDDRTLNDEKRARGFASPGRGQGAEERQRQDA